MYTAMAVGRITMKSLAKFGFCLMILLTSVAGKWLIRELIFGVKGKCASHKYLMLSFALYSLYLVHTTGLTTSQSNVVSYSSLYLDCVCLDWGSYSIFFLLLLIGILKQIV